jgi:hypothetical protein
MTDRELEDRQMPEPLPLRWALLAAAWAWLSLLALALLA